MFGEAYASAGFGPSGSLQLDVKLLHFCVKMGHLITVALFYGEELIGYTALVIGPNLKRRGETQAQLVSMFIAPTHRGQGHVDEMIDLAEDIARRRGVDSVVWSGARGTSLLATLERRFADDPQEVSFVRRL